MTGNTLTTNPITGTNAYAHGAYGTPQQGFWGNTGGFGGNTPFGFGTQGYQPQVMNPINTIGGFTPQFVPQTIQQPGFGGQLIQQPGLVGQPTSLWQTGLINHP